MMETSPTIGELAEAIAAVQAAAVNPTANATNPAYRSRYADLDEVTSTLRPLWAANGLAVVQLPGACAGGTAAVETLVAHRSGEWLRLVATAPLAREDAQGVGSVTTYLRRYALMGLFGLAADDDDANAAVQPGQVGAAPGAAPARAAARRPEPEYPVIALVNGEPIYDYLVPLGKGRGRGPLSSLTDPKRVRSLASWLDEHADDQPAYVEQNRRIAGNAWRYADWLEGRDDRLRGVGQQVAEALVAGPVRPEELPF